MTYHVVGLTGRRKSTDWSGQTAGHLRVLGKAESLGTGARWRVECMRCGDTLVVPACRLRDLKKAERAGKTTSCATAVCKEAQHGQ
jgi:hypothetical protein